MYKQPRLFIILGLAGVLVAPALSGAIELHVTTDVVTLEGVTLGGEVAIAWAGKTHGVVPFSSWDTSVICDDDRDGTIVLSGLKPAALGGSIWAIADITSGIAAAYHLRGSLGTTVNITQQALESGGTLEPSQTISAPGGRVSLLLVRPGVGAWHTEVYDGTENDHDGAQDHIVMTKAALLAPAGRAPSAPASTQTHDVVIGLDSRGMIVTITTIS
ncbi:MAG: hypothetical protein DRJ61_00610 [Acidobacteria bacterium]|nr:MAG: hypothetical protein DRJ61_00610 [Acidobacteriota bacterium]